MEQKKGEKLICPHCNYEHEDVVEDFVVPGCIGERSTCEEDCTDCYKTFEVTCTAAGVLRTITISET